MIRYQWVWVWAVLAAAACAGPAGQEMSAEAASEPGVRVVEIVESVSLDPKGKSVRVWLPIPRTTAAQSVELLGVDSPVPYRQTEDPDFGNKTYYLEADHSGPITISAQYRITRRERRDLADPKGAVIGEREHELYLKPRGLVVINEEVQRIADAAAGDETDDLIAGRKLYDAVLRHMAYDKTTPGWGRGDTARACKVGKGNCTDFHSLFLSVTRARGIPSRFHMGIPFSSEAVQSVGRKYHCWAEFYVKGKGWIAVDISEAWKLREKTDYFFGNLDEDRITMTIGRDIRLEPPQAGRPLNYFAYPYVEVDGKPHPLYDLKREVRTIKQRVKEEG